MRRAARLAAFGLAAVLAAAVPAAAQSPADAIRGVIGQQIEAFRADDFETAFGFASPAIRQLFQTPGNFGSMVRNGYPMVWRPSEVTYLELKEVGGRMWQEVLIRDAQGGWHRLEYEMIPAGDGWAINGVRLLDMPEIGA